MALTNASLTQGSSVTNTNNVITGTGVFDDLMESVTAHLEAQFQLGRITGTDFATVYLGAMQSALQSSVSYTLGQEKTNADVVLIGKQGLKVDADKLLVDAQELLTDAQKLKVDSDIALNTKQGALLDAQELKVDADVVLVGKQGTLTDNQAATELKKALDVVNTTTNRSAAQTTSETTAVKQRLLLVNQTATELKQALDIVAATSLKDKQVLTEVKQALDIVSATTLKDAQKLKVDGEKALILQKQVSEYPQTLVTGNTTANANSILGKQTTLYGEQAKGFKWNADQKYLKTLLDAWAINVSTAGTAVTGITALNPADSGGVSGMNTIIGDVKPTG